MRSRYTAYVRRDVDYLVATHDPETREDLDRDAIRRWASESKWLGLTVKEVVGGGEGDETGEVEFVARYEQGGREQTHHERSRFRRVDGVWYFAEGRAPKGEPVRKEPKPSPNAPCPCGSGKKYKRCHGA